MDKRWIKFAPLVVVLGVMVLFFRALSLNPNELALEKQGELLPEFALEELYTEKVITREDLRGKPILLHVWASWCGVCKREQPTLVKLKERGVPIIGVNYRDDPDSAKRFLDQYGNPFKLNLVDMSGKFGLDLGVYGTPETYVIDGEGRMFYRHVGPLDMKTFETDIKPLLKYTEKLKAHG